MKKGSHDPAAREYFTNTLNLKPGGREQRTALCPLHDDNHASLSVNLSTGLWTCHGPCGSGDRAKFESLLARRARRTWSAPAASRPVVSATGDPKATTYVYTDSKGEVLFRKVRLPQADGGKTFRCEAKHGEDWDRDLSRFNGAVLPLYNMKGITRRGVTTLVKTEGEKDADRLRRLLPKTHAAFTNHEGGATNKWHPEYDWVVKGKHVVVCEDNDEVGRKHAAFWAEHCLLAGAASVKVDSYAELDEKADVSDYLDANPDSDLLKRWAALPAWDLPGQELFLTLAELLARQPEKVDWLWEGYIPKGSAVLLTGQSKIGKSTLVNCFVRARGAGKDFLGRKTAKGRTVLLTEMSDADLRAEADACSGLADAGLTVLAQNKCPLDWGWPEVLRQALRHCKKTGADLLVVDTFSSWTLLENHNDAAQTLGAYHHLRPFLAAGIAVLIEDHEGIDQRDVRTARRGSTALAGQASVVLSLRHLNGNHGAETGLRQLQRVGRHGTGDVTVEWANGDYVYKGTSAAVAAEDAAGQVARVLPRKPEDGMSPAQIAQATGCKRSTLQRALEKMVANGVVRSAVAGKASPKNPRRYWLGPAASLPAATEARLEAVTKTGAVEEKGPKRGLNPRA